MGDAHVASITVIVFFLGGDPLFRLPPAPWEGVSHPMDLPAPSAILSSRCHSKGLLEPSAKVHPVRR